ncbi:MAG: hypothetical protein ACE5IL_10225 [Myxococcota bacterium]
MTSIYASEAAAALPRLLSMLDRERHQPSFGSFDRDHWAWKFRDFPLTMLQYGLVPLAAVWAGALPGHAARHNDRLRDWIVGAIDQTLSRQHACGAFDSVAPNTFDHGVTLAMTFILDETARLLSDALPAPVGLRVERALARAADFALDSHEGYAFISNHRALFALAYHALFERFDRASFAEARDRALAGILAHQSPDGWYEEYGGPDPGYETLGLFYLSLLWERANPPGLLASLERSIEFLAHCVQPDGSVGGAWGSRQTRHFFPAGLERLAGALPRAGAIAHFVRDRLGSNAVVTLRSVDAENLPTLLHAYLDAAEHTPRGEPQGEIPSLPCQSLRGRRDFPASGITLTATDRYYALAHGARGGLLRVFERTTGRLCYEDAGYVIRTRGRSWVSQLAGLGSVCETSKGNVVRCRKRFFRYRPLLPTPLRMGLLRALNLTVFRSRRVGAWIRDRLVQRLVSGGRPGAFELLRTIEFHSDRIRVHDRLVRESRAAPDTVDLVRSLGPLHMGSARYFHASDLASTPLPQATGLREALARARTGTLDFTLRFGPQPGVQLLSDTGDLLQ